VLRRRWTTCSEYAHELALRCGAGYSSMYDIIRRCTLNGDIVGQSLLGVYATTAAVRAEDRISFSPHDDMGRWCAAALVFLSIAAHALGYTVSLKDDDYSRQTCSGMWAGSDTAIEGVLPIIWCTTSATHDGTKSASTQPARVRLQW
jgi:hypothetical protein